MSAETGKEPDSLQKIFQRPFFLCITIGIPFCIYKLLFGLTAIQTGSAENLYLSIFGGIVVVWALADLAMNIGQALFDLLHRPLMVEYCIIAQIGHFLHKPTLFLAIDTFLAFSIVCFMLWSFWIARLSPLEAYLWIFATTLNLISLSLVKIYNEILFYRERR